MAAQVAGVGRWLRDRVWVTLDPAVGSSRDDGDKPEVDGYASDDVVREVYGRLGAELEMESERRRAVEAKLLAVGAVAPMAVTIMGAVVAFLSSGRVGNFVPESVVVISVISVYVALQFLRAMLAAVAGLTRRAYAGPRMSEIVPSGREGVGGYLRRTCNECMCRIEQHREATNEKVSQLAVAHEAMRNAVTALVVQLVVLVGIVVWESVT